MNEIAETALWYNLKTYLATRASCLLDTILCINDETSLDPKTRYANWPESFTKQFSLIEYSSAHTGFSYPFVGIYMETLDYDNCSSEVILGFQVSYHSAAPTTCEFGCGKCIGSSPEAISMFRRDIIRATDLLIKNTVRADDDTLHSLAFFDELRCQMLPSPDNPSEEKRWCYNIVGSSVSPRRHVGPVLTNNEIHQFNVEYRLAIDGVYGDGYCDGNLDNCISC